MALLNCTVNFMLDYDKLFKLHAPLSEEAQVVLAAVHGRTLEAALSLLRSSQVTRARIYQTEAFRVAHRGDKILLFERGESLACECEEWRGLGNGQDCTHGLAVRLAVAQGKVARPTLSEAEVIGWLLERR
jgi:hypothetical protein